MMSRTCPRATKSKAGLIIILFAFALILGANVNAYAQGDVSVTLTWTAPGDDGSSGTATSYDVRYSTSAITEANWGSATQASGEPSPHAAGTDESFTVTGLDPNTTYYFAIKTSDEVGNTSAISNIANITTDDTVAPAAITDLAAASGE